MKLPIEFWIISTALISAAIGFLGASLAAGLRYRRIQQDTWAAARHYYDGGSKS